MKLNKVLDALMRWFPDTFMQRAMALAHCVVIIGVPGYFCWAAPERLYGLRLVHATFAALGGTFSLPIVLTIVLRGLGPEDHATLHRERCKYWAISTSTFLFWAIFFS